jgi:hypothetical protein
MPEMKLASQTPGGASVAKKVGHELRQVALITGYLYVCFAAVIFYKFAVLRGQGISYAPYGLAVIKALVLGKFVLLGHAAKIGDRYESRSFMHVVAQKSFLFLVLLLVLTVVEEVVIGLIQGRPLAASLAAVAGGSLLMILASSVIMLLILVPYIAFRELKEVLGEDQFWRILLERREGLHAGKSKLST